MTRITTAVLTIALLACAARADDGQPPEPPWKKTLEARLARKVTLDFSSTPLPDVVQFIEQTTGVNIVVDRASDLADELVDLRVDSLEVSSALKLILELKGAMYQLRCGVLLVGKKKQLDAYPADVPPRPKSEGTDPAQLAAYDRLISKKLTLSFDETPFADVKQFIDQVTGVAVPIVGELPRPAPAITLSVKNLGVARGLALVAHQAGGVLTFADGAWKIIPRPKPKPVEGGAEK